MWPKRVVAARLFSAKPLLRHKAAFQGQVFHMAGEAGFDVNESLIAYSAADSYGRILLVGFLNTLELSILCIVGATVIGVVMKIIRASNNWLGSRLAMAYVELLRNPPKLLILLYVISACFPLFLLLFLNPKR